MKSILFYIFLNLIFFGVGFWFPPVWILAVLCGLIAGLKGMKEFGLCQ